MNDRLPLIALLLLGACAQPAPEIDTTTAPVVPAPVVTAPPAADVPPGELNYAEVVHPKNARLKIGSQPFGYVASVAALDIRPAIDHKNLQCEFHATTTAFDLGVGTRDAAVRGCYDNPKGQYVHVIVNNKMQYDVWDTAYALPVTPGRNYVLSFLARSYGESVKDLSAFKTNEMILNSDPGGEPKFFWGQEATLFYYLPAGEYKLSEGKRVLLDFYLLNCTPAVGGYNVRATIDGEAYLFSRWAPYYIEGLAPGAHTVRLELLDPNGKLTPGPYNDSGTRTFTVTE